MNFNKQARKTGAVAAAVFFLFQQTGWTASEIILLNNYEQAAGVSAPKTTDAPDPAEEQKELAVTALDFLQQENPLKGFQDSDLAGIQDEIRIAVPEQDYEYDRYSVSEALDLFQPEYAAAVLLKSVSAEDLRRLQELSFETAIVVLNGETVLFTTGNESEIGASTPAGELLKKAAFISHIHSRGTKQEGPSAFDLQNAVAAPGMEYVITAAGAYAYNEKGIQNGGEKRSLEETASLIEAAREAARKSAGEDQTAARSELNQFIHEMDIYNQAPLETRETFRRALVPVSTLAELQAMKNDLAGDYYLVNDIDATGLNWEPVGTRNNAFRGSFNGNGFKITNLTINRPAQDYVGLFGSLESAGTIENVKLENVSILGRNNVGAVSGYMFISELSNAAVDGGTVTGLDRTGGLVGESYNGSGINNSHSNVSVSGNDEVGGIVGKLWDGNINDINQSYASGNVTGRNQVGGLAGYSKSGDMIRSYASGNITGQDFVGGLVGLTTENAGIRDSYYSGGTVSGTTNRVGGIAGLYGSYDDGIQRTHFAGTVTSAGGPGGFLGVYSAGVIADNYWDTTLNPGLQDTSSGDMAGITGRSTAAMQTQNNFTGWNFKDVWVMNGYPRLQQATAISTLKELKDMSGNLTAKYYLVNNIDAGSVNWAPVGTRNNAFRGAFNGNGRKITNLTINRPAQDYVGLFGSLESAGTIENVKLENVSILGRHNVGAVTGYMFLAEFSNAAVDGGTVTGLDRTGGLVGESYNGLGMNNSHSNVSVSGNDEVGGIVGKLWDGNGNDMTQTYALGTVNGRNEVGGLAGYSKSGDMIRSYASGNVTGQDFVGGLVGLTTENTGIRDSYYSGGQVRATANTNRVGGIAGQYGSYDDGIQRTYFAGTVTSGGVPGGFLGVYTAGAISDNYWDTTLNPGLQDRSGGDMAGITGQNTTAMQTQNTFTNWNFSTVWFMNGYPRLQYQPPVIINVTGSVNVQTSNGYVNSPYASVSFQASAGVTEMRYTYTNGNDQPQFGGWSSYQPGTSVWIQTANVGGQDGPKTIYAQFRNAQGVESAIVSSSFIADTLVPTGTVQIAGDRTDTGRHDLQISLQAQDAVSGVDTMRISVDGGALWTPWEAFNSSAQVHLPRGAGQKEVLVELRDHAGNKTRISDTISVEENLLVDIVADAQNAQSTPVQGDVSGTRTGDHYVITGTNHIESTTAFTFPQGIDMKGSLLGFRYNVLQGAGDAALQLKEKLSDGSYVIRETFSPIKLNNAGSGEHEIVFPVMDTDRLSRITDIVLVIQNSSGNFNAEITDFDLRDAGYEPPPVSNGDVLTNGSLIYTMLNVNGQPSHNGEFFPANSGLTAAGAYHFDGIQQGGTETEFFQNLDRPLNGSGKTLRIVYESSTGAAGSKITLRNAQDYPSPVYELPLTVSFEATAPGVQKILELQIPSDVKWENLDQITLSTYGQGAIDLTLHEMRMINTASQPVLTDPLSLIIDRDPGKIFLSPEVFASRNPDGTIIDVLPNAQGKIVRIETQEDIFGYFYDAQGNLIKAVQAAKKNGEIVFESEYQYEYEVSPVNGQTRLKEIREYQYVTERINAALGVTPSVSSALDPLNAGQSPFPAAYATDGSGGDTGRPWIAALEDTNPALTVDLGKFTNIDEIQVDARFFGMFMNIIYPKYFVLSGSLDGNTWFDLAVYDSPEYQEGTNKLYKFELGLSQMRYVRVRDLWSVIPYWVNNTDYPELSGFPIANPNERRAYISEITVMENRQKTVLSNVYRPEYGCLYGCQVTVGNPVAQIKKNAVTESGEVTPPVVTLTSSIYTQGIGAFFLDFLVDGQAVRRQVSGPLQAGNNLRAFSFENAAGSRTLLPVNVIMDATAPAATLASVSKGNPALGQTYRDTRFNFTGISDATSGLREIRCRVDGGAWSLSSLPAGTDLSLNIRLPEGWGDRNVQVEMEDQAGNIRQFTQTVTIEVSAYLADVDFKYFLNPYESTHGAFELTHSYPHEGYDLRLYTQPSHFGFGAQLLSNVIAGRIVVDYLTRDQAISILKSMITNLLNDQTNPAIGVMGLLPWMNFDSATQDWRRDYDYSSGKYSKNGRRFMLGDNSNMAVAFAAALGALANTQDNAAGDIALIKTKLQAFLANQAVGYQCLASTTNNPDGAVRRGIIISENAAPGYGVANCAAVFSGGSTVAFVNTSDSDNPNTGIPVAFEQLYGSEFRAGILFAVLNYNLPDAVYKNLTVEIENYTKQNDTTVYTVSPVDGGAFQMLWPALTTPELLNPAQARMQKNFLDVALDFAARNSQPGFLSAAYGTSGYVPNAGIAEIAHNSGGRNQTVTSVYTLGAAFAADPARMTPFLQTMVQSFPGLVTGHGLWEGVDKTTGPGTVVQKQVFSNVASFILGILGTGANDMLEYLNATQEARLNNTLWKPAGANYDVVSTSPQAFSWQLPGQGVLDPLTGRTGDTYRVKTGSLTAVGTAFKQGTSGSINTSGKRLLISYRASSNAASATAATLKVEFKEVGNLKIRQQVNQVILKNTGPNVINTVTIDLPAFAGTSQINEMVFVLNGNGQSVDIIFEDVDLIDLNSTAPLSTGGRGGPGEPFMPPTEEEMKKAQEYTLSAYALFFDQAREDATEKIAELESQLTSLQVSKAKSLTATNDQESIKEEIKEYEAVLTEIIKALNSVESDQKKLAKKGLLTQKTLDEMLARFGGIYALLYGDSL